MVFNKILVILLDASQVPIYQPTTCPHISVHWIYLMGTSTIELHVIIMYSLTIKMIDVHPHNITQRTAYS